MKGLAEKKEIIQKLQNQILTLQGLRKGNSGSYTDMGLGPIANAFPDNTFPLGAIHEFISSASEDATATNGFISGLLSKLMLKNGICLWISNKRTLFPPALNLFGIEPERIIFIDLHREKDVLWAVEEALKCNSLAVVVGELKELDFAQSRRLQLAVEKSKVTGFIHRHQPGKENPVTCVSRWKISPLPSVSADGMPGLGFPRWQVELSKVRNGQPGIWRVEWAGGKLRSIPRKPILISKPSISKIASYA
ncbi:MAG: Error-prone repair protein ImuA [Daejeonella sp.]